MKAKRPLFLAATVLTPAAILVAITNGLPDTANEYRNTGAFVIKRAGSSQILSVCSGTLIAPHAFLTASHCTAFFENVAAQAGYSAYISFDNPIPFGTFSSPATNLIPVAQLITNPLFNQRQSDSGDIGLLLVAAASTQGIQPAALPTLGLLDQLNQKNGLKNAVFTAVGYGVQNRVTGGGPPFFESMNPIPRMYSFSGFNALNPGYLRLSQNPATGNGGTCFGDSGGPNFLTVNSTRVIAAVTVTGDSVCRATNVTYRLDTPSARQFLGGFVTLP